MADEIHFGDLQQPLPRRAPRPDENRQFVVAPVGQPDETDLPIFIDFDVHIELDRHAASDTSVELGGVLLGRACHDLRGRPFVVVTDCIRAEHYESTKGSFKFTHETWSAITRERLRDAPDLQMVGWYHTHPGWGVFLSGMDLFICENFFNKPLDIAYVIDPCQGSRGMFQWTDACSPHNNRSMRPTGGYFLITSRFRSAELQTYLAELNSMPARLTNLPNARSNQSPESPSWQTFALLGMLTIQLLLIAILAWKVLTPDASSSFAHDRALASEKLMTDLKTLAERRRLDLAEERLNARAEFLDQAFRELKNTDDRAISRLQSRFDQSARLADDITARDAQLRELQAQLNDARDKILALEISATRNEERLTSLNDSLRAENTKLLAAAHQTDARARDVKLSLDSDTATPNEGRSIWLWIIGSGFVLATLLAVSRHYANRTHSPTTPATA